MFSIAAIEAEAADCVIPKKSAALVTFPISAIVINIFKWLKYNIVNLTLD